MDYSYYWLAWQRKQLGKKLWWWPEPEWTMKRTWLKQCWWRQIEKSVSVHVCERRWGGGREIERDRDILCIWENLVHICEQLEKIFLKPQGLGEGWAKGSGMKEAYDKSVIACMLAFCYKCVGWLSYKWSRLFWLKVMKDSAHGLLAPRGFCL